MATVYAVANTIILAVGVLLTFAIAWQNGNDSTIENIIGLAISLILAPVLHELGHIVLAHANKMRVVYAKFFCFKIYEKEGKRRFGFASPFGADETQTIPMQSGNMQKRACAYTLGGLVFGGGLLFAVFFGALLCTLLHKTSFLLWGALPYLAYLFLLNALPMEYASGKTDMAVYLGLKNGNDAEKNMLSAMEIHGCLSEGKSFAEIDEKFYFDTPQLAEDEPLFAVMLDLRYRYYLDKNEIEKAADCLNRLLPCVRDYLPEPEAEKIAAEFVYIHSLLHDLERAEECGKTCQAYLRGETVTAKRVLAAFSAAFGKTESVAPLLEQAEELLKKERIAGVAKFEKNLLSKIRLG